MRRSEKGEAAAMARQTGSLDGEARHWGVRIRCATLRSVLRSQKSSPMGIIQDNLYLKIDGRMVYLWRAVDAEGEVLDVLVQAKRNKRAALKLMRKLLTKCSFVPDKLVTDDLRFMGGSQ